MRRLAGKEIEGCGGLLAQPDEDFGHDEVPFGERHDRLQVQLELVALQRLREPSRGIRPSGELAAHLLQKALARVRSLRVRFHGSRL